VKIRGCRIELGEIEAVLQRHPDVREAVAMARPDERGQLRLVAYVVAAAGAVVTEGSLVEFLHAALPAYMVPTAVVVLASWPLTPNGKIDRRALPAPARAEGKSNARTAELQTDHEKQIADIWRGVLGRDGIGRHDDFFQLGGHSLLAAQATTRLAAVLGISVSVRVLFDHPTLADFAAEVAQHEMAGSSRPPVLRAKRRGASAELELAEPR
jgi:hypothetical protein